MLGHYKEIRAEESSCKEAHPGLKQKTMFYFLFCVQIMELLFFSGSGKQSQCALIFREEKGWLSSCSCDSEGHLLT